MRVVRSKSVVFAPGDAGMKAFNYVTGAEFECDGELLSFVTAIDGWTERAAVEAAAVERFGDEGAELVDDLIDLDCLMVEGDEAATAQLAFEEQWGWGLPSAILHNAVTHRAVNGRDEQISWQAEKAMRVPPPPLVYSPADDVPRHRLPDPDTKQGLYTYLEKRRTNRDDEPDAVPLGVLSDILFAGLGITGWTRNNVQHLPLKYAPSGGARNPYDGYVYVRDVEGVDAGFYRYSGVDHSLTPVAGDDDPLPSPAELLGGQAWADNAACLIVLVADFQRTMWKYEGDDNAYRVVMIEAGHIAQNMMLMAASKDLSACPSAALDHGKLEETFGIKRFDQSPVYCLALTAA